MTESDALGRRFMTDSKRLAEFIGPILVAVGVTEAINMEIFAQQMAPIVYLNGALLFVAGLAIVRAHNLWTWRWPVIVTLSGWIALFGGFWRMIAPNATQATDNIATYVVLGAIGATGAVLTVAGYTAKTA